MKAASLIRKLICTLIMLLILIAQDSSVRAEAATSKGVEVDCGDSIDNDDDGFTDCDDFDCMGEPDCMETECSDSIDNDNDTFTDCEDSDCIGLPACVETECMDEIDNDGDGFIDCEDFDCVGGPDCTEMNCMDGIDNDSDGFTDCDDFDCNESPDCSETDCNDGVDNDQNGFTDCDDLACADAPECAEGEECSFDTVHTADQDGNNLINLSELLRVIQFFNSPGFGCELGTEDGYAPDDPDQDCCPHASDYTPQDWTVSLSELLRLIQFFNSGGYTACPAEDPPTEDGYCPGAP